MNSQALNRILRTVTLCAAATWLAGCASTSQTSAPAAAANPSAGHFATKYKADDGRTIEIGKSTAAEGGWLFKEPHMDKCWLADGFTFAGFDTLYIAPTASTAKLHNDAETRPHELAKENMPKELERVLRSRGIFANIVLREADLKPEAKVLKLENTIVDYAKGGGAARYFAGLYGAGQPVLRVQGKMTGTDKTLFSYEARRSGVSAGARMTGVFMKDEDIQLEDIRSMSLDIADFISAVAGKFQPK